APRASPPYGGRANSTTILLRETSIGSKSPRSSPTGRSVRRRTNHPPLNERRVARSRRPALGARPAGRRPPPDTIWRGSSVSSNHRPEYPRRNDRNTNSARVPVAPPPDRPSPDSG